MSAGNAAAILDFGEAILRRLSGSGGPGVTLHFALGTALAAVKAGPPAQAHALLLALLPQLVASLPSTDRQAVEASATHVAEIMRDFAKAVVTRGDPAAPSQEAP